jgi:hypothetical protein
MLINFEYSMSIPSCLRFLRPYSQRTPRSLAAPEQAAYLQFYAAARRLSSSAPRWNHITSYDTSDIRVERGISQHGALQNPILEASYKSQRDDVRRRTEELQDAQALKYPRIKRDFKAITCADFRKLYNSLKPEEVIKGEIVTLRGTFLDTTKTYL